MRGREKERKREKTKILLFFLHLRTYTTATRNTAITGGNVCKASEK